LKSTMVHVSSASIARQSHQPWAWERTAHPTDGRRHHPV